MSFPRSFDLDRGDFLRVLPMLFFVEFARGAFLMSFLPAYATNILGLTVAIVGTAVTAHYLTDTVVKVFIGYLLDRLPVGVVVHTGLIVSMLGLFSIRYVTAGWTLVLASALYGIGLSPVWLVCLSKISSEQQRATQMGMMYAVWMGGLGLGLVSANFLIDVSYRVTFWILIGVALLSWFASLLVTAGGTRIRVLPLGEQLHMLWLKLKDIGPLFPGMVLQTAAAGMLMPVLPSFASEQLGVSYGHYSYMLMAGGIFAVLGLVPMGRLSDALGKKWFLVSGFLVFAATLCLLAFTTTLFMGIVWAAVLGLSYSAVLPAWNAILAQQVPSEQQGVGWGIFSSMEGIGTMIGPLIGGWLADWFNIHVTIFASAFLLAGIGVFYLFYPIRRLLGETAR